MVQEINEILVLSFIFAVGSMGGWFGEVLYRRFITDTNPERKWINPGFLQGPYLPLYGLSLTVLYLLAGIPVDFIEKEWAKRLFLFFLMALVITAIEYVGGLIFIKGMNIQLWDYTNDWGNIQGIICPKYSLYWMGLSAIYYFLVHGKVINMIYWLAMHQTFCFFVGFFYGIFAIDLFVSLKIGVKIRDFARENQILVRYEDFKEKVVRTNENIKLRVSFMFPFMLVRKSMAETFKEYVEATKNVVGGVTGAIGNGAKTVGKTIAAPVKKISETVSKERPDRYQRDVLEQLKDDE